MTMIAGFKINEIPFLMGDFVISAEGARTELKRKIVQISKNCAVAWTGSLITASYVFTELLERFTRETITRTEFELFLQGMEPTLNHPVHLICIIIEEKTSLFLWNSGYPEGFFDDEDIITDGSGAPEIEPHIRYYQNLFRGADIRNPHQWAMAIYSAAVRQEALADDSTDYGFSYEMLFFYEGHIWPLQFLCHVHVGLGVTSVSPGLNNRVQAT